MINNYYILANELFLIIFQLPIAVWLKVKTAQQPALITSKVWKPNQYVFNVSQNEANPQITVLG
jgi:hypothetical protein